MGEANGCYLDGKIEEANRILHDVVKMNPTCVAAYNLLGIIAEEDLKDIKKVGISAPFL
jgi:hypothetical protein